MDKYIIRKHHKIKDISGNKYDRSNYEYIFTTKSGKKIKSSDMSPKLKSYIKSLKIPPGYEDVKICLNTKNRVLAIGTDSRERKQYIYNPEYKLESEDTKYYNLIEFGRKYKKIMKKINSDLTSSDCIDKEIATVLKIISECNFRIGNDIYRDTNNSYGVSTLESKHIKLDGETIEIEFIGKKGVNNRCRFKHRKLSHNLRRKKKSARANRSIFNISNSQINNYLKDFGDFSSKNFRTWNANIEYIYAIQKYDIDYDLELSNHKRKILSNKAVMDVADKLHHTSAVCKKNYIDKQLIELYIENKDEFYNIFKVEGNRNKNLIIEQFLKYLKNSFKS